MQWMGTMTTSGANLHRGRGSLVALWATQVALAAMFLTAGGSRLVGVPAMVSLFDLIGIGPWLRYVTGVIEVISGIALLVPSPAVFGAHERIRCPRLSSDPTSVIPRSGGRRMGPSRSASTLLTHTSLFSEGLSYDR